MSVKSKLRKSKKTFTKQEAVQLSLSKKKKGKERGWLKRIDEQTKKFQNGLKRNEYRKKIRDICAKLAAVDISKKTKSFQILKLHFIIRIYSPNELLTKPN